MMPPAMRHTLCVLLGLALLSLALPAPVLAGQSPTISNSGHKPKAPPRAGEGGDAVLPAGYKSVFWGASPEIVQGIRDRVMESQPAPNPHVTYLIDAPRPGETEIREVVKWKFWDGALVEVHIHYEGPFTRKESRDLVAKFQRHYAEGKHEVVWSDTSVNHATARIIEEWWTWEDPFTIQVLKRLGDDESWIVIRHSRVLELARRAQEERELEEARTGRVRGIELD